jgi:hypothetical protein
LDPAVSVKNVRTIRIHPAIGIARLGNSPDGYFIGPELPGVTPKPKGGYKDAQGRVKRQAARFRLYGYDARGKLLGEITAKDARITWTVHVANKKASWRTFDGLKKNTPWRNSSVTDRSQLHIDPGPFSLTGTSQSAEFTGGRFMGEAVALGEMRTDSSGRLLVLGGFGTSRSPQGMPLNEFANNDGWHDDVSDGPVTATVTFSKSPAIAMQALGAWVICPPPDFAPDVGNVITLYDTLLQVAVDRLGWKVPARPSFSHDIYPIIQKAMDMKWVSMMIAQAHAHATLENVVPPPGAASTRAAIFGRLRDPATPGGAESDNDMPMLWSDYYPATGNEPLTRIQYEYLRKWKSGRFVNDWRRKPKTETRVTPAGLDRAALQACVGGAFFPGIEASWMLRDHFEFIEPFRIDHARCEAGDVTKQMAVPWQADFTDCTQEGELAWWPAQRPDQVFPEHGGMQMDWTRGIVNDKADMVASWYRLGFVVKRGARRVETERG